MEFEELIRDLVSLDRMLWVIGGGDVVSENTAKGMEEPTFSDGYATVGADSWHFHLKMGSLAGVQFVEAEDHGIFREELLRLYSGLDKDGADLKDIPYTELFSVLGKANLSFDSIATFLETNMRERYDIEGPPDVGVLPADLEAFLKTSVSLKNRARKLQDLEHRWYRANIEEEDE